MDVELTLTASGKGSGGLVPPVAGSAVVTAPAPAPAPPLRLGDALEQLQLQMAMTATKAPRATGTGDPNQGSAAGPEGFLWGVSTWDEQRAAACLGYDETSWDRGEAPPTCMHPWASLTADEQRAASSLGYTSATWNTEVYARHGLVLESREVGSDMIKLIDPGRGARPGLFDAVQVCESCRSKAGGRTDTDGVFYCNSCWKGWTNVDVELTLTEISGIGQFVTLLCAWIRARGEQRVTAAQLGGFYAAHPGGFYAAHPSVDRSVLPANKKLKYLCSHADARGRLKFQPDPYVSGGGWLEIVQVATPRPARTAAAASSSQPQMTDELVALISSILHRNGPEIEISSLILWTYSADPNARALMKAAGGAKCWLEQHPQAFQLFRPRPEEPLVWSVRLKAPVHLNSLGTLEVRSPITATAPARPLRSSGLQRSQPCNRKEKTEDRKYVKVTGGHDAPHMEPANHTGQRKDGSRREPRETIDDAGVSYGESSTSGGAEQAAFTLLNSTPDKQMLLSALCASLYERGFRAEIAAARSPARFFAGCKLLHCDLKSRKQGGEIVCLADTTPQPLSASAGTRNSNCRHIAEKHLERHLSTKPTISEEVEVLLKDCIDKNQISVHLPEWTIKRRLPHLLGTLFKEIEVDQEATATFLVREAQKGTAWMNKEKLYAGAEKVEQLARKQELLSRIVTYCDERVQLDAVLAPGTPTIAWALKKLATDINCTTTYLGKFLAGTREFEAAVDRFRDPDASSNVERDSPEARIADAAVSIASDDWISGYKAKSKSFAADPVIEGNMARQGKKGEAGVEQLLKVQHRH